MDTSARVIVVGAGFAGLRAALELTRRGMPVTVLEARERVGGRVWSTTLQNGAVAEMGAEWIAASDLAVHSLARELRVDLVETGADYGRREAWGHDAPSTGEQHAFSRAADRGFANLDPALAETMSVGSFLDRVPGSVAVRRLTKIRLQGTSAYDIEAVALGRSDGSNRFAHDRGPYHRAARGNQALASKMAREIADLRTGHPVDAVERDQNGVRVHIGSHEEHADAVVIAVPAPIAAKLSMIPALPTRLAEALRELPMGEASKLAVATEQPPTARARQSTDISMWSWAANGEDGVPRPCIASFAGSAQTQRILGVDRGLVTPWFERVAAMHPDVAFVGEPSMYAWADDPFTLGAYSAWDMRSLARVEWFREPMGRLVFAGEHTAGSDDHGTMNGALLSGLRAAEQVLERLG
jgi:monoamine oxidase